MLAAILLAAVTTLAPVLTALAPWVNTAGPPPTENRVTIVDVFTFDCINCKHVTPELPEEHVHANVVQALKDQDIAWPVIYDDSFRIWNEYGVNAWPTQLVFDKHGKLRATYVGEGYDAQLERTVRTLAAEK